VSAVHYDIGGQSRCNRNGMASNKRTPVSVSLTSEIMAVTCLDCQRMIDGDVRKAEAERLQKAAPDLYEALRETWRVLHAAGLLNLSSGVQLGQTAWYVNITDVEALSDAAIAKAEGR
jgi:hypothetical protein